MIRIAAFDLDGTVLDGDSQALFLRFLTRKRLAPPSLLLEVASWRALNHVGWKLEVPKLYARVVLRCGAIPRDRFRLAMEEFVATRLARRIRRDAERWTRRVRDEGCHVVLLSASIDPIVASVASAMSADGYAGTRLTLDSPGVLSVAGEMLYGEAKMRALQAYADARFPAWRLEYAFGNDYGDRFLLGAATNPIVVCPTKPLRALAAQRRWPCETWR